MSWIGTWYWKRSVAASYGAAERATHRRQTVITPFCVEDLDNPRVVVLTVHRPGRKSSLVISSSPRSPFSTSTKAHALS
eukprot:9725140-Lingulodinium_polyedra.AAC.1